MRKFITLLLSLVLPVLAWAAQSDTLRILCIGNSFSQDAVNQNFGELACAAGKHVVVGNLYIGGCSLQRHWKSLTENIPDYAYEKRIDDGELVVKKKTVMTTGIFDEPWDIVTFQQSSPISGKISTFEPYIGNLIDYIKSKVPSAKRLMWHQTWAYPSNTVHPGLAKNYGSREKMYAAICSASREICAKYGLEVIPTGTAIQNLKTTYIGDNCHRDGSHLSYTIGRYTAACVWFEAIFGESVIGNAYNHPNMQDYRCEIARTAAHLAVASPFALTGMSQLGFTLPETTTDESKVPQYTLPDPLVMNDGTPVRNKKDWMGKRRGEILELFRSEVYGRSPEPSPDMHSEILRSTSDFLDGKAVAKEVRIFFKKGRNSYMDLLVITPKKVRKAPVFLGVNFKGNYAISGDEWISMDFSSANIKRLGILDNRSRGAAVNRWPLDQIIDAGYGIATFYRGDVAPDYDNSFNLGVIRGMAGKTWKYPAPDEWGNISAWAWGLSRAMDYLEGDPDVDARRVAVIGHSRLGKTALWAAAQDQRFAMAISNCSGCVGAALSRREYGETVESINRHFPHWFCDNFKKYDGRVNELPVDQHELLALIAPRPLYVASGSEDLWADPKGEGLALEEAEKVYRLFGKPKTGRHVHQGKHGISLEDWVHYIEFANKYMK